MAKMQQFQRGKKYMLKLKKLEGATEEVVKKAIFAGAEIIADQVRINLNEAIGQGKTGNISTGDLVASFGITPIKEDQDGIWNAKIGFDGYDSNGVPNQLKARVLNSGTSDKRQKATHFVENAVNAKKNEALKAIERTVEEEMKKIMK